MKTYSDSSDSLPASNSQPSWTWLQERLASKPSQSFEHWMDQQLTDLELHFAELITIKSRAKSLRSEICQDKSRS